MVPPSPPVRTGVFISHSHQDEEVAAALRELLQIILGLSRSQITCSSDAAYGMAMGSELDDQIRGRLETAKAVFLVATAQSSHSQWVQYECAYADQASARGEMHFYVLTPIPADIDRVPAPYRDRIAVTLSRAREVREFTNQLRETLAAGTQPTEPSNAFDALLHLHNLCSTLEREELETKNRLDRETLDREQRELRMGRERLIVQRLWSQVAAGVLLLGLLVSAYEHVQQQKAYRAELAQKDAIHGDELARKDDDFGKWTEQIETKRDAELRRLPLTGVFQDAVTNQVVPCRRVTAHVLEPNGHPKSVAKDCIQGRFTFRDAELGVDPRERFTLVADIRGRTHEIPVDRVTTPLALVIRSVQP
jgi:hypothetical protein